MRSRIPDPILRVQERRHEGKAKRQRLQFVATNETARGVVPGLILDDAGHGRAAPHAHGLVEHRVDRAGHVSHVVAPHLSGRVRQSVREHRTCRIEQKARAFDRVAGDANDPGLLQVLVAVCVCIKHAGHLAGCVVLDLEHMRTLAHLEVSGRLTTGNVRIGRRPFGSPLQPWKQNPVCWQATRPS